MIKAMCTKTEILSSIYGHDSQLTVKLKDLCTRRRRLLARYRLYSDDLNTLLMWHKTRQPG
eukprot:689669-Amphidinium_carterae.2